MDLRSLNTFIQVAELRSFTRAAERLGYSQPTISFQIKQLEIELGAPLFERIGHTVELTGRGREALAYAQRICRLTGDMVSSSEEKSKTQGHIRIAMADSLCSRMITDSFQSFQGQYPDISLKVIPAGTDEMLRLVDHNEADIICMLDSRIHNTTYVTACSEQVKVSFICSSEGPFRSGEAVSMEEVLKHPFILTEKGMSYRRIMEEELAKRKLEVSPVLEIGRVDLITELVSKGVGISLLPDYATERDACEGRISRFSVEGIDIRVWKQIMYHRDKWLSKAMESTVAYLSGIL